MKRIYYDKGLIVETEGLRFMLDPRANADFQRVELVLVTHGHSDHVSGLVKASGDVRVGASRITHEITKLVRERAERNMLENTILLGREFGIEEDEFSVRAYDAGHCMGSLQFKIDTGEQLIGYTGDINFCKSMTERKADVMDCEILVMEATYGSEEYVFPDREEVYSDVLDYVEDAVSDGIPTILAGYSLGKCQELTRLISRGLRYEVLVSEQIFEFNRIFERFKYPLGKYLCFNSEEGREVLEEGGCVILIPQPVLRENAPERMMKSLNLRTQPRIAVCSGWAVNRSFQFSMRRAYGVDAVFPLSSHADFNQLLDYVRAVEPSQVYTTFGNPVSLAKHIKRKLKIKAQPVVNRRQQTLEAYTVNQEPQITIKKKEDGEDEEST